MKGNASVEAGPILVVDDDPKIAHLVRAYLEREGFSVASAGDGIAALAAVRERPPRLIVLDVMLPELDGLSVARRVREESDVPILMLSARGSVAERVHGIAEGADDYLPKPFSPAELVVRVKAILRRSASGRETHEPLRLDDLVIDRERHEVLRRGERLALSALEFRLLVALVEADGRVLSRDALLDALYGAADGEAVDRTIDVYVRRLRERLGDAPERPRYVATVRGIGYRALVS
ncbi:MAG TPA: response regulator transcription factor [Candidatus Limnocylindria bacterium]|jgi:DNA-binding response OmpR family regulator|nr:response regulator transcription factor [Candidatus Limnocylindria bacterium]